MTSKIELRKQYRMILKNLDNRWLEAASRRLCRRVEDFFIAKENHNIKHVLCFSTFFAGEPDLSALISALIETKKVYLPRLGQDSSMVFISLGKNWQEESISGDYSIPSPTGGEIYNVQNIPESAILVPGLVFDTLGNRLGRGKGYYDRFLQRRENQGINAVGIGWEIQISPEPIPTEPHDIVMNWIISEERILKCQDGLY